MLWRKVRRLSHLVTALSSIESCARVKLVVWFDILSIRIHILLYLSLLTFIDVLSCQLLQRGELNSPSVRAFPWQLLSHLHRNHLVEVVATCLEQFPDFFQAVGWRLMNSDYWLLHAEWRLPVVVACLFEQILVVLLQIICVNCCWINTVLEILEWSSIRLVAMVGRACICCLRVVAGCLVDFRRISEELGGYLIIKQVLLNRSLLRLSLSKLAAESLAKWAFATNDWVHFVGA